MDWVQSVYIMSFLIFCCLFCSPQLDIIMKLCNAKKESPQTFYDETTHRKTSLLRLNSSPVFVVVVVVVISLSHELGTGLWSRMFTANGLSCVAVMWELIEHFKHTQWRALIHFQAELQFVRRESKKNRVYHSFKLELVSITKANERNEITTKREKESQFVIGCITLESMSRQHMWYSQASIRDFRFSITVIRSEHWTSTWLRPMGDVK